MTKRKKPKTDAAPAIADRLLTLREAVDVLQLNHTHDAGLRPARRDRGAINRWTVEIQACGP